jgi:anti-sigma factor RsiW
MDCKEARDLLPAFVDGELGVREGADLGSHIESCAQCRAALKGYESLRGAIRQATYFQAPDALERRVRSALPAPRSRPSRPVPRWNWMGLGGAFATVVAVVWSVGLFLALPSAEDRVADDVVSSHVRAMLSNRGIDVASSDQHTVKPWFNGKLDFAPPVSDLTGDGFPLVGGRLDYLDHRPVATLVYRHRLHTIDVFVSPARKGEASAKTFARQGYNVLRWTHNGMVFWAVSDVEAGELKKLSDLIRSRS